MRYYVYILLDDTKKGNYNNEFCDVEFKPFYVGKGDFLSKNKKERHLTHYKEMKRKLTKIPNLHKYNTIKKLQENGFKPNFIIVCKDDDEKKILDIESKLIKFYGKVKDGGLLTNISDGGVGGNLFSHVEGLREKLNELGSKRWGGENNPNYNKPKEETYSFKYKKEHGHHWNTGRKITEEQKIKTKKTKYEKLPNVEMICPNTYEIIDVGKTVDMIKKYQLKPYLLYRCLNQGGRHKNFFWKYQKKDLVLSKSKVEGYVKPKIKHNNKKIYFKKNINDIKEVVFSDIYEASQKTGFCEEVIRRKCRTNNSNEKIFRYENGEYNFNVKNGKKIKVISIDENGNEKVYESATDAAKDINGNVSLIIAICKGKRKKHKKLTFKYF
jgi:hypothetical protein